MTSSSIENFRFLSISFGIVISIAGTVGNMLAILAFLSNSRIRTAFNLLVVNLAAVDCIISVAILPIVVDSYYLMEWGSSHDSCIAFAYFYFAAQYTSAMFLVLISFNRFMHVARPHSAYSQMFSLRRRRLIAGLTWLIAPIFLFPLIFTNGFGWWEGGLSCTFSRSDSFTTVYSLTMRALFQLFPLVCMTVLYYCIFQAVRKSHATMDKRRTNSVVCESVYNSTESCATVMTPVGTPSGFVPKRNYQLRLEPSPPSPGIRNPSRSSNPPSPKFKSSIKFSSSPSPQLRYHSKSLVEPGFPLGSTPQFNVNKEKKRQPVKRAQSESSSDFKKATLRRQSINSKYASICRNNTLGDMLALPKNDSFAFTQNKGVRSSLQKSRSSTCLEVSSPWNPDSTPSPKMEVKISDANKSTNRLYRKQRPQNLSFKLNYSPNNVISPTRSSIKRNLSLPNLRRTKSLSSSQTNVDESDRPARKISLKRRSIRHAKAQRKLVYMCIVICSAFALCSLPSFLVNFIGDYDTIQPEIHMLTTILSWLTSLINPIVYAAMNKQFRKEYSRMLKKISKTLLRKNEKERIKNHPNLPTIHVTDTCMRNN